MDKFIKHSPESQAAAEAAAPIAGTKRWAVLQFIAAQGIYGATDDEIQVGLGMNPSTERPRRIELYEGRFIVKLRTTRPTRGGRQAAVWLAGEHVQQIARTAYCVYPEQ